MLTNFDQGSMGSDAPVTMPAPQQELYLPPKPQIRDAHDTIPNPPTSPYAPQMGQLPGGFAPRYNPVQELLDSILRRPASTPFQQMTDPVPGLGGATKLAEAAVGFLNPLTKESNREFSEADAPGRGAQLGFIALDLATGGGKAKFSREALERAIKASGLKDLGFSETIEGAAQAIEAGMLKGLPRDIRGAIMAIGKEERQAMLAQNAPGALEDVLEQSIKVVKGKKAAKATGQVPENLTIAEFSDFLDGKSLPKGVSVPRTGEQLAAEMGAVTPVQREFIEQLVREISKKEKVAQAGPKKTAVEAFAEDTASAFGGKQITMEELAAKHGYGGQAPTGNKLFPELPEPPVNNVINKQVEDVGGGLPRELRAGVEKTEEVLGAFKTLLSSGDISATARQSLPFLLSHPIASGKAFATQLKAIRRGDEYLEQTTLEQMQRSTQNGLTELYFGHRGGGLVRGEEAFVSRLFDKAASLPGPLEIGR